MKNYSAVLLLFCFIFYFAKTDASIPVSMDDVLKVKRVGNVSVSSDSDRVAYDIILPASDFKRSLNSPTIEGLHLREAFIYDVKSRQSRKLINNANTSSWIGPWSPDGSKLILYSIDVSRSDVSAGVYDVKNDTYKPLPGVPVWITSGKLASLDTMLWLSDNHVIYSAAPEGDINAIRAGGSTKDRWKTINEIYQGEALEKPTSMVYDSKPTGISPRITEQSLVIVNVDSGSRREVLSGAVVGFSLAPNKQYLAVSLRSDYFVLPAGEQEIGGGEVSGLSVNEIRLVDLDDIGNNILITSGYDLNLGFPVRWSADSTKISYYAFRHGQIWEKSKPYIYDLSVNKTMPLNADGLHLVLPRDGTLGGDSATPVFFIADVPYVFAPLVPESERERWRGTHEYSRQWRRQAKMLWKLSDIHEPAVVKGVPGQFQSMCAGVEELLLHNESGVVFARFSGASVQQPLRTLAGGNLALTFCSSREGVNLSNKDVFAVFEGDSSQSAGAKMAYVIKAGRGRVSAKMPLSKDETIVAFSDDGSTIITVEKQKEREALYFWNADQNTRIQIISLNDWVLQRQFPDTGYINYRIAHDARQDKYVAWYMLPIGYEKGKRYPMVVSIYPGMILHEDREPFPVSFTEFPYNPYLAAASGYVSLVISAPVNLNDTDLDIPQQMADAVNAAVEESIRQGFADPDRLAIEGHSAGGYAVASVLTKTRQFKAAIAGAGIYNLTSFYGSFMPQRLHDPTAHLELYYATNLEGATGYIGVPPWKDPQRYVRNSPLFEADKIETPLLLIHGHDDYAPVKQAEEMFTALVRQGKPARFVRYWGEEHLLTHPGNKRDSWVQVERWLNMYLRGNMLEAKISNSEGR